LGFLLKTVRGHSYNFKAIIIKKTCILGLLMLSPHLMAQKYEDLALTPPMGWNSWNVFKTNISEQLIKDIADVFISDGYKDAGYEYIVIDDCWSLKERDSLGNLVPDPEKFPNGIKAVADYVHSLGLKFGIYADAGTKTCAGYPGSKDYEYQDAETFASWGIDYLKYDWCYTAGLDAKETYTKMGDALYAAGRPVLFSLCEWGNNQPWEWGKDVGHQWRISGDIAVCFDCEINHGTYSDWGVMRIVYYREGIRGYAGPDHWNDFDIMEVGNGMTQSEDRAHFSLWCMFASPLIMGNDIRSASEETKGILMNWEVIEVNQDSLGIQAFKYSSKDSIEIWVKPLKNDEWAVLFLNRNSDPYKLEFNWEEHVMTDSIFQKEINFSRNEFIVRDLWVRKDIGMTKEPLKAEIPVHDVIMVRLTRKFIGTVE
jgi:alpha-galactosidase